MDISREQIKKLFELASMEYKLKNEALVPNDISEALIEIEKKLHTFQTDSRTNSFGDKKVLIVDDLELSIYQLNQMLKKIGIIPVIARKKEEALEEINKVIFDCIIVDLFLPDSKDGFEVISQAAKYRREKQPNLKIIVISGTDDKSLMEYCYELGADIFVQKGPNWHSELLKRFSQFFQRKSNDAFTKFPSDHPNIITYSIKKFNDPAIFDELLKDINAEVFAEKNNIILDMQDVTLFDTEFTRIFTDIYKTCATSGGMLVLVSPPQKIKDALANAYLEGVIPLASSMENAMRLIKNKIRISRLD